MPVRYSQQQEKTGAAIGTIVSVPKPTTWTDNSNPLLEGDNWDLLNRFPGWLECNGQTLLVSEYTGLYEIIGNTYGGTPGVDFQLPDYRSKKLMGTGNINGNKGGSPSLTPNAGPGTLQADINQPGSEGGTYTIETVRQLPPGSEITPGAPGVPDVFFDVGDDILGQPIQFIEGVAYEAFGSGTGEIGGFLEPIIASGPQYIAFGTRGNTPFNTTQYSREFRIQNLDLTGYVALRIFSIAGNDSNGGERTNNVGEGLRVIWPGGEEDTIIPAAGDLPGGIPEFDEIYTSWTELKIDIPIAYRTTGTTIRFRQDLNANTNNPFGTEHQSGTDTANNQNAFDMFGIQRIGFLGGAIGGDADDTFEIGRFRSSGFEDTFTDVLPNFSGNASWSAGTSGQGTSTRTVATAPEHTHTWVYASPTNEEACAGSPYYSSGRVGFQNTVSGIVVNFNRDGAGLKSHSHMVAWGFVAGIQTYGNSNTSGNLANQTVTGNLVNQTSISTSNNVGNVINKTVDAVNDLGVSINPGIITLSAANRQLFDNALDVRLQAAEEIELMSDYARVKYIIKAY